MNTDASSTVHAATEDFSPLDAYAYAHAHPEFYAPLWQVAHAGPEFSPSVVPVGWDTWQREIWTGWSLPGTELAEQGWKVHVSARLDRAQHVLDAVARACFAEAVNFKHVRARLFFLYLHHKHGQRQQAGKFCAAYPPDEASARRLMDRLSDDLAGEEGPYVLTDRRYRDSRTVHYRWGAFRARARRRPDGTQELLLRDPSGREVVDVRAPAFVLPKGMTDPFAPAAPAAAGGPVVLRGYEIVRAIRHSNAGGTYEGRELATGRRVFVKEARAHNGLNWDGSSARERLRSEHAALEALHVGSPGVCPQPLDYFREWEHEFLVTEYVDGVTLQHWISSHSPVVRGDVGAEDFPSYYAAAEEILAGLDGALARIHAAGYRFGDVSASNVLVTPEGTRLVDFEAASHRNEPPVPLATVGYAPPGGLVTDDPFAQDAYGADAIAMALLMPLHSVMRRSPGNLRLLRRDLEALAPVPSRLWERARRCFDERELEPQLPSADELDRRPLQSLERFADDVRRGLEAMADPEHPDRLFPTVPRGFLTNVTCVAYGAAGVLHSLRLAGAELPAEVVARFRRDAMDRGAQLPPGLHVGLAGAAWALAGMDLLDEATALMERADQHPMLALSTTLGEGLAGVGLAHLSMYHRTGDELWLKRAAAAASEILARTNLLASLGPYDAVGLLHGRSGLALFLYYLARDTGNHGYLNAGRSLLHQELDRAIELSEGALSFPEDARSRRASPYLDSGSAGIAMVATRYVATSPDDRLAEALPRILRNVRTRLTVLPGLYRGLAGLVLVLADHANWAGGESDRDGAVSLATGLVKYAVPHPSGSRFLGDRINQRYSAELWSGAAGVLLALRHVLEPTGDHFFTLDHPRILRKEVNR